MIHYIVAVWLGPRRVQPVNNPYAYLRHQLYFLKNSKSIDKTTFVVNHYDTELEKEIEPIIASFGVKANVIYRKNLGCSYAAFQEAIIQNLEYDYHFLIEDDCVPTDDNFLVPYLNEMREDAIFSTAMRAGTVEGNGLLSGKFAKKVYSKRGVVFKLCDSIEYGDCQWNQLHFLDYLKEMGRVSALKNHCYWYQWPNPLPGWLWGRPGHLQVGRLVIEAPKFNIAIPHWATKHMKVMDVPISVWQTYHKLI